MGNSVKGQIVEKLDHLPGPALQEVLDFGGRDAEWKFALRRGDRA